MLREKPNSAVANTAFSHTSETQATVRRIALVFLAAAGLLIGSMIFVYRVGLLRIHAQQKMANQLVVLRQLGDFLSDMKDAETGQRGYLLTGDEPYLEPYSNALQVVGARVVGLRNLALSGELPKNRVERVGVLTQEKLAELARTIQVRRDKGLEAVVSVIRNNHGKQVMDEIRDEVEQMSATEARRLAEASQRERWATDVRTATFCAACLLNLAFLGWASRQILREVRRREEANQEARQQKEMLGTTLASIGDGVMATDAQGRVRFLNAEAERLTGWKSSEAAARPLTEVFRIMNEQTRQPVEDPVGKVLRLGTVVGMANHTVLVRRDGSEVPIDDSAAPIRVEGGPLIGVVMVFRDVREQRKAASEARLLAAIVEHSEDAIWTKNLDGAIQTWNASAEKLFKYRAEEIVGKPVTLLVPEDRVSEERDILTRLRQGQAVERLETVRLAKGGQHFRVAVSVSPLRSGDGEVIGASSIVHDVTELAAAREALVREKELLATTLASIGDAVIVTDAEGRVTFLNREAERLTKWANTEATGRLLPEVFRIINEDSRAPAENPVEKVLRVGGVVGLANHTVLIGRDGAQVSIDDSAAQIRVAGGPLLGVVLVFRDFTERKLAQQAVRESEALLSAVLNQLPVGVGVMDMTGRWIVSNAVMEGFLPKAIQSSVPEQTRRWRGWDVNGEAIPPENWPGQRALRGEVVSPGLEMLFTDDGGSERWMRVSTAPLRNAAGERIGATAVVQDVDAIKRAEEVLRRGNEELEGLVAERTARLQEFIGELEHVSYTITHDMRAPLRAMRAFAEALKETSERRLGEEEKMFLDRIITGAERMDALITDALSYNKAVRTELPLGPVNLGRLLRGILETYPQFQGTEAEITLQSSLPLVMGNEAGLTQCFSNLLENAVKFARPGSRARVRICSEARHGWVRLWVEDDGIGISREMLPRVFDMFAHGSSPQAGTGIGLALVRKVVDRMGGRVGVESELGQGSRFWVDFKPGDVKQVAAEAVRTVTWGG